MIVALASARDIPGEEDGPLSVLICQLPTAPKGIVAIHLCFVFVDLARGDVLALQLLDHSYEKGIRQLQISLRRVFLALEGALFGC